MMESFFCAVGGGKDFVIFNVADLSDDKVEDGDLAQVRSTQDSPYRSAAWSSGVEWYFVVSDEGIALFSVSTMAGYLCRKKTWRFIELFLDSKMARKARR